MDGRVHPRETSSDAGRSKAERRRIVHTRQNTLRFYASLLHKKFSQRHSNPYRTLSRSAYMKAGYCGCSTHDASSFDRCGGSVVTRTIQSSSSYDQSRYLGRRLEGVANQGGVRSNDGDVQGTEVSTVSRSESGTSACTLPLSHPPSTSMLF